MAQVCPLCSSPSSAFCDITARISSSSSYTLNNLKFPNFHPSRKLSPLNSQSKPFLHPPFSSSQDTIPQLTQAVNSLEDAKLDDPDAKSSPLSKTQIHVNSRNPKAKRHWKNSPDTIPSLAKLVKSLNSCHPSEQHVSEILKGNLGDNVTGRDAVLILNNMVNPDNALFVFKYFQKFESGRHVILYNVTMKLFRETREFERAEKLFDEMLQRGVKPNLITFSIMISCAALCSMPHKAVEWFEMMPSFKCEPYGYLSSYVIPSYARTGNVDMALKLYDRAKKDKLHVNAVAFSSLIKLFRDIMDFEKAEKVLDEMLQRGVKPNVLTFSALSKAHIWVNPKSPRAKQLLKNSFHDTLSLVKLAKSLDSCDPNEQQVSEILKGLGDKVTERDAVLILDNMVNPDNALFVFKYFQHKFEKVRHVILYNVTMNLFRETREFERAEKLFDEMLQRGVKPNLITFSTMISCAALCSMSHKAIEWFEMMPSFECEPDDNLSSSMISSYAHTGNVDMAVKLYDCAKKEKWHIDTVSFSTMIKMYGKSGNYDGCISVYNDMKVLGAKPNMATYNNLLRAMGKAKSSRKAKAIYEEMKNNGISPNQSTYAAVLQAYCRGRYKEGALSVYKEMKEKGKDMDSFIYNMLLDMCAHVGYANEAVEIFEDMKRSVTCQPNIFIYSSLINMYACSGKVSEAEAMLNEMISCGFEPDILVLTMFIHCYGKAKRTDDVVKIFNQFWDLGISPDDRLCDCLLYVMTHIPKQEHGKITDCIEKANPKLGYVVRYLMEEKEGDGDFKKEASELLNSVDDGVKKFSCNSLIDLCVNLGVQHRARDLLDLGLTLGIYKDIQFRTETQWSLHLKKLSVGAAMTALHVWIDELSKAFELGEEVPSQLGICTGPSRHYKRSDKELDSVFESYLKELNAPFHKATNMAGWFLATNQEAKSWLQSRGSTETVAALNSTV